MKDQAIRRSTEPTIRKVEGGFPHSEIPGSKLVRSSPRLIAAYHVLHRLSAPRHPPNTLKALDCSHYQCPHTRQNVVCTIALRRTPSMSAMCSRTLTRKTSLLRKIGPIARRSSFATKIVLQLAHLTHLAMSCDARAPKTIWRLGMVPANCFAGSKLGSISSLRCQKTRTSPSIRTNECEVMFRGRI